MCEARIGPLGQASNRPNYLTVTQLFQTQRMEVLENRPLHSSTLRYSLEVRNQDVRDANKNFNSFKKCFFFMFKCNVKPKNVYEAICFKFNFAGFSEASRHNI